MLAPPFGTSASLHKEEKGILTGFVQVRCWSPWSFLEMENGFWNGSSCVGNRPWWEHISHDSVGLRGREDLGLDWEDCWLQYYLRCIQDHQTAQKTVKRPLGIDCPCSSWWLLSLLQTVCVSPLLCWWCSTELVPCTPLPSALGCQSRWQHHVTNR